jgi:hypothetical protein
MTMLTLTRSSGIRPDGIYKFRIGEVEVKEGQKGQYISMRLTFADDPNSTTLYHNLSLTDKARFMVDKFLDAIGAPKTGKMSVAKLKGNTLYALITNETYNNRVRNVIAEFVTEDNINPNDVQSATSADTNPNDDDDDDDDDSSTDALHGLPMYREVDDGTYIPDSEPF